MITDGMCATVPKNVVITTRDEPFVMDHRTLTPITPQGWGWATPPFPRNITTLPLHKTLLFFPIPRTSRVAILSKLGSRSILVCPLKLSKEFKVQLGVRTLLEGFKVYQWPWAFQRGSWPNWLRQIRQGFQGPWAISSSPCVINLRVIPSFVGLRDPGEANKRSSGTDIDQAMRMGRREAYFPIQVLAGQTGQSYN